MLIFNGRKVSRDGTQKPTTETVFCWVCVWVTVFILSFFIFCSIDDFPFVANNLSIPSYRFVFPLVLGGGIYRHSFTEEQRIR